MKCGYGCGANQIGAPFDPKKKVEIDLGDGASSSFDFLVVACDPQLGLPNDIMQKTAIEKEMFSAEVMKSYYFQTTLMRFPKVGSRRSSGNCKKSSTSSFIATILHQYHFHPITHKIKHLLSQLLIVISSSIQ